MTNTYYVEINPNSFSFSELDLLYIEEVIKENNNDFEIFKDFAGTSLVVICENKPRDMPQFGLIWKVK